MWGGGIEKLPVRKRLQVRTPQPYTLHPKPSTLNITPQFLNPQPFTLKVTPSALHPEPCTLNLTRFGNMG